MLGRGSGQQSGVTQEGTTVLDSCVKAEPHPAVPFWLRVGLDYGLEAIILERDEEQILGKVSFPKNHTPVSIFLCCENFQIKYFLFWLPVSAWVPLSLAHSWRIKSRMRYKVSRIALNNWRISWTVRSRRSCKSWRMRRDTFYIPWQSLRRSWSGRANWWAISSQLWSIGCRGQP